MLNFPKVLRFVSMAVFATFITEYFGFVIVHSGVLLGLAALLAPGFYFSFFDLASNDWAAWVLSSATNLAYYYAIALFLIKKRI